MADMVLQHGLVGALIVAVGGLCTTIGILWRALERERGYRSKDAARWNEWLQGALELLMGKSARPSSPGGPT